jgi:eukaryotic-like serine/threonine-protein kinase
MPESAFTEGSLIAGRYRLGQLLGEGGMGEVWAATHTVTRRSVALKFLKESLRHKPGLRQRFLREASTASALRHPHVVEILDVFDFEERAPVLVMELLEGETLGTKLARDGRLSLEETAALLVPVCSAVGTAHALGIVHRDIKPENIFLARFGDEIRVKVLDFGIAKLTAEHYLEGGRSALITDTGSMLGTPCYMAPEQATGEAADYRADIWSIGVILYECLSGTRPIEGENLAQVVARLMSAGIIPLERLAPELPRDVAALVMQMLSREQTRRPQNLGEANKVLGHHTMFRAPGFGPPSMGPRSEQPVAERPRARLVTTRDADPQGATMVSAPPVGSSVNIDDSPLRPRWRRAAPMVMGIALLLLAAVGLSVLGVFSPSARPRIDPPPTQPLAEAVPAPQPTTTTPPAEAKGAPAHAAPTPAVASAAEKIPKTRKPLTRHAVAKKTPAANPPTTGARVEKDEGTLFPGRK